VAHSLSAKKRIRQNLKRRARNRAAKSAVKTQIKKYLADAKQSADPAALQKELAASQKSIDQLAAKGPIHKKTAARRKSRLARQLNAVRAKTS